MNDNKNLVFCPLVSLIMLSWYNKLSQHQGIQLCHSTPPLALSLRSTFCPSLIALKQMGTITKHSEDCNP